MSIIINPIYQNYFPFQDNDLNKKIDWDAFNSKNADYLGPLKNKQVDFSLKTTTWKDTAKKIVLIVAKIVLFPWGLHDLARYATQRIILSQLYPAQSKLPRPSYCPVIGPVNGFNLDQLDQARALAANHFNSQNYITRNIVFEKNGTHYSGFLIAKKDTITNGNWVIQAGGSNVFMEDLEMPYFRYDNMLVLNAPGMGTNEGEATPFTIGEVQELGIRFLETAIKAQKIVIAGHSIGGAAMGQAILQHDFKEGIKYLVVHQMTFDRASKICAMHSFKGVKRLVRWSGCEMDTVAASEKLARHKIEQVIIQSGTTRTYKKVAPKIILDYDYMDEVIPIKASLANRLFKNRSKGLNLTQDKQKEYFANKTFVYLKEPHNSEEPLKKTVNIAKEFFESKAE